MEEKTGRAWIEINRENLRHNVETLRSAMPPACELMAVVKAEAYGHGACVVSDALQKMGVKAFAVATIEEGIKLRRNGICGEILILGYTDVYLANKLREYDLMQTLIDYEYARQLNRQDIGIKTHIKIDTGMHRLGIPDYDFSAVREIFSMKNLNPCGIYTHLCCADSRQADDIAFTRGQINRFYALVNALKSSGIHVPKLHIQSSYGLLNYPGLACDYVRAGIALYGVSTSPRQDFKKDTALKLDLRPVLSLKSRVALIRPLDRGESVGYGRSFTAKQNSRIAILPIGYGDGVPRNLSCGKGCVMINRHRAPIVGHICMDSLAVDITDIEDVTAGTVATLIGAGEDEGVSAPVAADNAGSISNELLCRMGARLSVVAV